MRFFVIALGSLILFFPAYWLFASVVGPDWGAGIAAFGMYIAFPIVALKAWPTRDKSPHASMETALATGQLQSIDYDITEAVAVAGSEGEGTTFLLRLWSGETLFLSGHYLNDHVAGGRFPAKRIRLYWHAEQGHTYGLACLDNRLQTVRTIPPFPDSVLGGDDFPGDRAVLNESLDSCIQRFSNGA